jgi:hypothetical protein
VPTKLRHECEVGVLAWRRDQLLQSGFPPTEASRLAADSRFDLHALIELVDRGCPPPLAVRIAAPLEEMRTKP